MAEGKSKEKGSKWKAAFKALTGKGLPLVSKEETPAEANRRVRSTSIDSRKPQTDPAEEDPTYLALKQASKYYKKPGEPEGSTRPRKQSITGGGDIPVVEVTRAAAAKYGGSKSSAQFGMQSSFDSVDSRDSDEVIAPIARKVTGGATAKPKLSSAMKSVSLDTPDMEPPNRLIKGSVKDKRYLQSKVWNSSMETSDETRSEKSSPSCSQNGSTQSLDAIHIVIHNNESKLPEELELLRGDRIVLVDTTDPDWWHGYKLGDQRQRLGVFPCTCVAVMLPGERPMQLLHNINLASSFKLLRLYRDQIIFVTPEQQKDMVLIRTDKNYKAMCPIAALRPVMP